MIICFSIIYDVFKKILLLKIKSEKPEQCPAKIFPSLKKNFFLLVAINRYIDRQNKKLFQEVALPLQKNF